MKIAVFDPFCGASGNMILGALIDAGADQSGLNEMLSKLNLNGWKIATETVSKKSLRGTYVEVQVPLETEARKLRDIEKIIRNANLPESVTGNSLKSFQKLAEAEAEAHGIPVNEVHFHETGAMDAIIDIVGSFCCLHLLGIERVFSSPIATGTGTVTCAHGTLPVPSPATVSLLRGVPTCPSGIRSELTTPTGATILVNAVESWGTPPPLIPVSSGMGAGIFDLERPNLLRVTIGTQAGSIGCNHDNCIELRTILDDMDMRIWPDTADLILESGAFDCYAAMCIGRKGRPSIEVTVLCPSSMKDDVIECIFRNTTTLGIRIRETERAVLERDFIDVSTEFGTIPVKTGIFEDEIIHLEPEYEDCATASRTYNVPVQTVITAARIAADQLKKGG
ncbi:MAG: nickel pincer cofactor biosynthesis protein LarC [Candidatus Aegiribacteria sp.]|nr:nickel pincer cofactor biosynthesis protein LarC [Candidatus Aegiribacteria sp.]